MKRNLGTNGGWVDRSCASRWAEMSASSKFLALVLPVVIGCAGSIHPISYEDRLGNVPAIDSSIIVKKEILVPGPFSQDYLLPVGEYRPTHADSHGIFYASPNGVVERTREGEKLYDGGIHFPSQPGRYYTYPSLYLDRPALGFAKLPFPEEVRKDTYGTHIVFMLNGEPID